MDFNAYLERNPTISTLLVMLRCALLKFHLRGVEYLLAFLAVVTGFWVGWPWHNLYQSETYIYKSLCDYMPAWAWTVAFILPAIPSIFFSEITTLKVVMRIAGMGCLLSAWVLASLLFIVDKSPHLATAWTPVFAFYQGWAMLNAWLRLDSREPFVCPESCPKPLS